MGFFDQFKKNKPPQSEAIPEKKQSVIEPNIITDGVGEKFLPYIDAIIPPLLSLLRRLDEVEAKTFASCQNSNDDYPMYKKEYGRIAGELCTDELLARGYLGSFGSPTKYGHINKGCDLEMVMKSAKQASVILYDDRSKSYLYTYRFLLKNIDDTWKLCSVSCRLGDDDSWHLDRI